MRKIVKKIKYVFLSLSMSKKMSLIFTILVLITINFIYRIYASIYQSDMERNAIESFEQTAYLYEESLGNLLDNTEAIVKAPFYFQQLQEELTEGKNLSTESLRNLYYSVVAANISSNKYVIMLYDSNGKSAFVNASLENSYISQLDPSEWIKRAEESNGFTVLLPVQDPKEKFSFIVARNIISAESFVKIGCIAVTISKSELMQIYESISTNNRVRVMIYNGDDELLFSSDTEGYLPEEISQEIESSGAKESKIDTVQYLGYYMVQPGNKYKILIYAEKDVLYTDLKEAQLLMKIIEMIAIGVAVLLTILLTSFVTKPLRKITELMKKVEGGDWTVRFHALYSDEIGVMGESFNRMLDQMDEMMKNIVDISNAKKQVEIDALKGQINPHFMYNTIETFRMIAVDKEDDELADLLWRFGRMMRYNITTMNEMASIRSELEYMQYYIDIQNSRYRSEIQLICEVPEKLKEHQIIKLLIQPIVENAVFHGLRKNVKFFEYVKIKMFHSGERCVIEISDNGSGMSEEKLSEIRKVLRLKYSDVKTSRFVGLRNVNERISLFYGEAYGIQVENHPQGGVMVTISIPYGIDEESERREREMRD